MQEGLIVLLGKLGGFEGPAFQLSIGKDDRGVTIHDIGLGPGEVIGRLVFLKLILGRDGAVFRLATLGTPAAMGEGANDCRIEATLVGAGLAAGDDFGYLHGDRLLFPAESVNGGPQGFRDIRPYSPHH